MIAEALLMATTVWYIPGWMRTDELRPELATCISKVFPAAKVEFKGWDGSNADSIVTQVPLAPDRNEQSVFNGLLYHGMSSFNDIDLK